VNVCEGKKASF